MLLDLCVLEAREKSKADHTYVKLKFSEDYFSFQTYLAVSDSLHLESYACTLGDVYCFRPRFHEERSESKKFLPEIDMEFSQLKDAMNSANVKFLCAWVLEDLAFILKRVDNTIVDHLQSLASAFHLIRSPMQRLLLFLRRLKL